MSEPRVFFPQSALDTWLDAGRVRLVDDRLILPGSHTLELQPALRFVAEVADGRDPHDLVGKVKTIDDVVALGGEHQADSVLLGDNAYQVTEGFLARVAIWGQVPPGALDPVTRFFMEG